jgi:hypothetical protein
LLPGHLRRGARPRFCLGVAAAIACFVAAAPIGLAAAEPPEVGSVGVEGVSATGATLVGSVNPKGESTVYRFEYITDVAYEANLGAVPPREAFAGASVTPSGGGLVGSGTFPIPVARQLTKLSAATAYRYRLDAIHAGERPTTSKTCPFFTAAPTNGFELLDHRGWELVSPFAAAALYESENPVPRGQRSPLATPPCAARSARRWR